MRTTKLMAGALTLLVLVGGAAAAETVQSSESTVYAGNPHSGGRDGNRRLCFCKLLVSDGNHDSGERDQDWRTCL